MVERAAQVEQMSVGMDVETTRRHWRGVVRSVDIETQSLTVDFGLAGIQTLPASQLRPRVHGGCPCAQCVWEREHHQ